MARQFAQSVILILVTCLTAGAAELDISGTWEAGVLGSQIEVQVSQSGSSISGVAYISSSGEKRAYQFVGNINEGIITGALSGGHSFWGKVNSSVEVAGILRNNDGRVVPVSAFRR
jgi:hypothetical protein